MSYNSEIYLITKAIHIIFMVSYFAGIFYLIRIFVYHKDAEGKVQIEKEILQKQYIFMMKRLWNIIIFPAGIIMLISGITMIFASDFFILKQSWFHIKLSFLLGLAVYHFITWKKLKSIQTKGILSTSLQLRMLNEVSSVILFGVVFVVILKQQIYQIWIPLILGFIVLIIIIFGIVKLVNSKKKK